MQGSRLIKCTCRGQKCCIVVVEEFWPAYLLVVDSCWATGYSSDASVPIYLLKFIMGVQRYCFCFFKKIILFIYFWLRWVFVGVWAFPLVAASRGYSSLYVCRLLVVVASPVAEHRLQGVRASVVVACRLNSCNSRALEHRLNSFGTQTQLLFSMWDLLESGTQPMPSTLAGGCLPSTLAFYIIVEPLGEPQRYLLKLISVRPSLAKIVSSLSSLSILLSCFTFPHSICHLWTQRL